mmetsp:Transcript_4512/g.8687  ORF Transcript_4512/g.8687 Transcript_4512/m.8687 type:complete len:122 (+) Transcript_4512:225-590(+)
MKDFTILLILLNICNLQGRVQANLRSTRLAGNQEQHRHDGENTSSSSLTSSERTSSTTVTTWTSAGNPFKLVIDASPDAEELISWPIASIKRKITRRKLRVHKQSAELEKLRLQRKLERIE